MSDTYSHLRTPIRVSRDWRTRLDRFEAFLGLVIGCVLFGFLVLCALSIAIIGMSEFNEVAPGKRDVWSYLPFVLAAMACGCAVAEYLLLGALCTRLKSASGPVSVTLAVDLSHAQRLVAIPAGLIATVNAAALLGAAKFVGDNLPDIRLLSGWGIVFVAAFALLTLLAAAYASNAFLLVACAVFGAGERGIEWLHRHRYGLDLLLSLVLAFALPSFDMSRPEPETPYDPQVGSRRSAACDAYPKPAWLYD